MLTLDKNIILVPTFPIPRDRHTVWFLFFFLFLGVGGMSHVFLEGGLILKHHIKASLCQNKLLFVYIHGKYSSTVRRVQYHPQS